MDRVSTILSIKNLSVAIDDDVGTRTAISDISFEIQKGHTVALLGESGSGKSLMALAVMGILPTPPAKVLSGAIEFNGQNLLTLPERALQKLRGDRISMIFQEPVTSLNPLLAVGYQIGEGIRIHQGVDKRNVREQVLALMEMVGISDPDRRYSSYPHQLSGGYRQRVMIAMALACRPDLLLADEPTSALDTTVQAQIVDLLSRLIRDLGMSVLLITHDLGVVAALADRVVVINEGQVVEEGSTSEIFKAPLHPYTEALLNARPLSKERNSGYTGVGTGVIATTVTSANGCRFSAICKNAQSDCSLTSAPLVTLDSGRKVRCSSPYKGLNR